MSLFQRLRRKIRDVRRYPLLAFGGRDRMDLWLLGLFRNRVPGSRALVLLFAKRRIVAPRLLATRGQRIRVDLDQFGQIDVFDELFRDRIYDLESVDFAPALVVDCGAYCGYFSAMAAGFFPEARIVCFEANPANLDMLRAQLGLLDRQVEMAAAAVNVRGGTAAFSGGGMGGALVRSGDVVGASQVECVDFPEWLRTCAPESLVWKLDVEGAEIDLLPAVLGILPRRTVCFLETHHPDSVCDTLLEPYRDAGFTVRQVRRRVAGDGAFSYIEWQLMRER